MAKTAKKSTTKKKSGRIKKIRAMFDNISNPEKAEALIDELYSETCVFQDPIQRTEGREALKSMMRRTGQKMGNVRTKFLGTTESPEAIALHWEMTFKPPLSPAPLTLPGVSWMELGKDGRCTRHIDYWDFMRLSDQALPPLKLFHDFLRKAVG